MKLKKVIFSFIPLLFFFVVLEFGSNLYLKKYEPQSHIHLNLNPIYERDKNLMRHRRNPFTRPSLQFKLQSRYKIDGRVIKNPITKFSLDNGNEGIIRAAQGDVILNKNGFRGPYFKKGPHPGIFRILALGGSTTDGGVSNELTWPRALERMLNNKLNHGTYYQLINGGVTANNSCHVKDLYQREVEGVQPDMLLLMTGWNDMNKLRDDRITNMAQYCPKENVLKRFSSYHFLAKFILPLFPKNPKPLGFKFYNKTLALYLTNLKEIIEDAQIRGITVGLVSLPTIMDEKIPIYKLRRYSHLTGNSNEEIDYKRRVGMKINNIYKMLSTEYPNVFFIQSGLSFKSKAKGKKIFFEDSIHPLSEGYRILAYGIYKSINERLKIHPDFEQPYGEKTINHKELEVEYLKSILAAFKTEDLSYTGCVSIHKKCTHRPVKLQEHEYITSLVSFSIGSILLFNQEIVKPSTKKLLETFLTDAIKLRPNFSPSYWALEWLYFLTGQNELAAKNKKILQQINPELQNISFDKSLNIFNKKKIVDPFIASFYDFVEILKIFPNHVAPYAYYNQLLQLNVDYRKGLHKDSLGKRRAMIRGLYYTSPLLSRSIFENLIFRDPTMNDQEVAERFADGFKKIKREYYNEFSKSILK